MLVAVSNGNGTMAQFSHPEFGGSGQWMSGGMTMVSDLFNYQLKNTVNNLCSELSNHLAANQSGNAPSSFQSQSQNGSGAQAQSNGIAGTEFLVCARSQSRMVAQGSRLPKRRGFAEQRCLCIFWISPEIGRENWPKRLGIRYGRSSNRRILSAAGLRRIHHVQQPVRHGELIEPQGRYEGRP